MYCLLVCMSPLHNFQKISCKAQTGMYGPRNYIHVYTLHIHCTTSQSTLCLLRRPIVYFHLMFCFPTCNILALLLSLSYSKLYMNMCTFLYTTLVTRGVGLYTIHDIVHAPCPLCTHVHVHYRHSWLGQTSRQFLES